MPQDYSTATIYSKELCDEKHIGINARMKDLEHTVYGNGKPSLSTQIAELRTTLRVGMAVLGIGLALVQVIVKVFFP